jgi:hypothetical protein
VGGWGGIRDVFGLETTCYAALLLASYWAATRARFATAGVLGGLAFLARHDAVLFVAALFAAATWKQRRPAWRLAVAAGLTVAPWLLFAQLYFGSIFPNTLAAKLGTTSFRAYAPAALAIQAEHALRFLQPLDPGSGALRLATALAALLGAAALAGALKLLARDRLSICLLAFPLALWLGYAIIGPPIEHHWYLLPGSYFALLFGLAAGSIALRENPIARSPRVARLAPWPSGLVAAGSLLLALRLPVLIEREYERETSTGFYRGRTTVYREMAGFLLDTGLARHTLMTAEPGYLAYLSGSPVIDAAGLVTRDIFLHASADRRSHLARLADERAPDLLVPNIGYPAHASFPGYLPIWSGYAARALLMRRDLFTQLNASLGGKLEAAQQRRFARAALLEFPFSFDLGRHEDRVRWARAGGFPNELSAAEDAAPRPVGLTTAATSNFWIAIESPPFRIDFDALAFRFAANQENIWARLVVDGQVVLATSVRSERLELREYEWPVSAWRGRIGVLEVVDKAMRRGQGALRSLEARRYADAFRVDGFEDEAWHERWESVLGGAPRASAELVEQLGLAAMLGDRLAHSRGVPGAAAMRGRPFRIERETLSLLLYDFLRGRAVVELEVDGKAVRSEPGLGVDAVRPIAWQIGELVGREAVLVIRDVDADADRFVGVDEIRLHSD